jgi:monovalent cation:H+ antiporter, CPA1 family
MLDVAALPISLTAVFAWLDHRCVRLPGTIGVMSITLLLSLSLVALGRPARRLADRPFPA